MGQKRIIAASVALVVLVALLAVALGVNQLVSVRQSRAIVSHSRDVIEATQNVENLMLSAEGGLRAFLLNRDPRFRSGYQNAVARLPPAIDRIRRMVADNPDQIRRMDALRRLSVERMRTMDRYFQLAAAGNEPGLRQAISLGVGRNITFQFHEAVLEISEAERRLLATRLERAGRNEAWAAGLGLGLGAVALVGILAMVLLLARGNRRLTAAVETSETARRAQAASDALSAALFANSPDYLMVLDVTPDGRFLIADLNPAFETALRTRIDAVRGRAIDDLMPAAVAEPLIAHYRRVLASDRPVLTRSEIPVPGERARTWESILAPVQDETGAPRRIIGSTRDITERVQAEERLRASQRMEAVGQLTGGVAHDFNNLLQVIRGNIELLQPALGSDEKTARRLASALHGVDRAAQLTRQLLAYARRQPLEPKPINLARQVGDMGDMLRRTLGEAVEVETVVAGGLWNTIADPAQVESAILNLAINARDAMPDGGRLTIELTNAVLDDAYAREAGDVASGQYVLLAVTDTGTGMSPDTAARVFEPFFTTKSEGQGTGLGLSMVYGFVKQSNGHVQVYSEPGQGTTVKIYLPRTRETPQAEPIAVAEAQEGDGETILVVEDEEAVRAAAVGILEQLGYRCLQAGNAADALAVVQSDIPIDLIFTDVIMPGELKIRDFAEHVRVLRPDLQILFTSGYTQNAIVHQGRLDDGVHLLSKPYANDALARKVAEMLSRGAITRMAATPSG